ncbi:MAG: hypothetical protein L3J47_07885 [Sulfurovum sp.]|nr:hypothetical protein [Sulfurovum sp.]
MGSLVEESLKIADERFKAFGFSDTQREQLLVSAKRDLESEVAKLRELLALETTDLERINQSLHAIKGLLYNMGNTEAGDRFNDLRNDTAKEEQIQKIEMLLQNG